MEQTYKECQSCGMPLSKDPGKGGTNADGSKNHMYCSYCYQNGAFVREMTVEEMQEYVKKKMQELGFPGFMAGMFTKGIPKLKRWNP
jgi:hypothetical protein